MRGTDLSNVSAATTKNTSRRALLTREAERWRGENGLKMTPDDQASARDHCPPSAEAQAAAPEPEAKLAK